MKAGCYWLTQIIAILAIFWLLFVDVLLAVNGLHIVPLYPSHFSDVSTIFSVCDNRTFIVAIASLDEGTILLLNC